MVVLGHEEVCQWADIGHYRTGKVLGQTLDYALSVLLLPLVSIEHSTAVLRTDVVALSVQLGGIVAGEEDLKQSSPPDYLGIEAHSDYLGMTGALAAHLLVGRVVDVTARVSRNHLAHATQPLQRTLNAPETAPSED